MDTKMKSCNFNKIKSGSIMLSLVKMVLVTRPRRPSELSSEALARSVEKLARMNRKLARELPIT